MMTVTEFTSLSKNYDALNEEQRLALEKITYRYPYFQAVYALYLKSLKEQEKFNFDLILKKTAVISPDRNTLYEWLYSELEVENSTAIAPQEKEKTKPVLETVIDEKVEEVPQEQEDAVAPKPKKITTTSKEKNLREQVLDYLERRPADLAEISQGLNSQENHIQIELNLLIEQKKIQQKEFNSKLVYCFLE